MILKEGDGLEQVACKYIVVPVVVFRKRLSAPGFLRCPRLWRIAPERMCCWKSKRQE